MCRHGRSRIASGCRWMGSWWLLHYIGRDLPRRAPADVVQMRPLTRYLASSGAIPRPDPQEISMKTIRVLVAALGVSLTLGASAQTKWDLPTAYPPTNFHTENITQFVADVDKATAGKLKITVHSNASLFKANEIKRAVQTDQAQIGEVLISAYANEDPLFGADSIPFLATSYADAAKLWKASRKALDERFAKQGMRILYAVPWPPQGI